MAECEWFRIDLPDLEVGRVATVVVNDMALAVTRTEDGYGVLDNRCPHQGGPLGDGEIGEDGWLCGARGMGTNTALPPVNPPKVSPMPQRVSHWRAGTMACTSNCRSKTRHQRPWIRWST